MESSIKETNIPIFSCIYYNRRKGKRLYFEQLSCGNKMLNCSHRNVSVNYFIEQETEAGGD